MISGTGATSPRRMASSMAAVTISPSKTGPPAYVGGA